ncbi:ATP-binding protein [Mitsuaria sp. GD03876]|uniref:AAA family ATPase n=1 Tax=Mitsuaria sp. GD03876 TaxID=2975399 RepID=UPI00244B6428|nr:ATP-binding protein [Mitsuaria sp. GD03876]MDH0865163.1 AAA family ATPase [Mitsuaria sp. GD03876]
MSFREGAAVSFRLDANVPPRISLNLPAATVMCVKGANGSGKTHLLKGLAFVASFVSTSFSADPEAEIPVAPFFSDPEPTSFFVDFLVDEATYRYELDVTPAGVVREALFKASRRKTLVFERTQDTVKAVARLKVLEGVKVRRNASLLATAYHHQIDELVPVHAFFKNIHFNVGSSGTRESLFMDIYKVAQLLSEHDDVRRYVEQFLRECDIGITRLRIASEEGSDGKRRFFPVFIHEVDGRECDVMPATESAGTKQIFRLMLPIAAVVAAGSVLVLDELDLYLHPHLLPKLLGLFLQEKAPGDPAAQLLFSTHHNDVMDLCGRYRTVFVNKDDNQSYAYRLDEIPGDVIRNDRTLVTPYNDRKIGGVPRL